jgi:peptide/nickel transport system substrate-binding protein
MAESAYWTQFWKKKVNRRRLLAGSALTGTGLAAAAAVGCSSATPGPSDGGTGGATGGGGAGDINDLVSVDPVDARRVLTPGPDGGYSDVPLEVPPENSRGGTLTYIGFDAVVLDRYDPHQTQFGPMYSNLSAIFSKLYMYASHNEPTWDNIVPDIAESAPEMIGDPPDTYVVKLRKGVRFHNTDSARSNFPELAGRELTADDVIFSYQRQTNDDSPQKSYYYRSSQYKTIDSMEKVDDYTIRFTTKGPVAPFYHFLADTNAHILARELIDEEPAPNSDVPWDSLDAFGSREPRPAARMIGTGPFTWKNLEFGIEFEAGRNPEWFGWSDPDLGRPWLDAYKATGQGLNDATIESLFRKKEIDVAGFINNPDWIVNIKDEIPELEFHRGVVSGWVGTRFKTYCKPFDDWRVRRALDLAVDRQEVVDVIGSGAWVKVGPVGKAVPLWALPDEELQTVPGYRTDPADRDADITEARQLFEAAGKPELPQIWFADVPDYIPRFVPTYLETIKRVLGIDQDIRTQTNPYSLIAEGLVVEECDRGAMTWGFDNGWIDLDDWVYPYFKTGGPKNSFQVSDPTLDALLDAQRAEFDFDTRLDLGYQIQRYLLGLTNPEADAAHVRPNYAAPGGGTISWPYFKNRVSFPWFGNSYWNANIWLDQIDPSYQGRPG